MPDPKDIQRESSSQANQPKLQVAKVDPRSVQCPRCWADEGQNCGFPSGEMTACHGWRWAKAQSKHEQDNVAILRQAIELMASELAVLLPSKPRAGDVDLWIRYASAVLERDQRGVDSASASFAEVANA